MFFPSFFFPATDLSFFFFFLSFPEAVPSAQSNTFAFDPFPLESEESGPEFSFEPPNEAVFSNSTGLRLDCVASGLPRPVIEWYQEDQIITHNLHGLRVVLANGSLVFPPFR